MAGRFGRGGRQIDGRRPLSRAAGAAGAAVGVRISSWTDAGLSADLLKNGRSFLESIEAEVKKRDKRLAKVLRASYREGRYESAVVNHRGVRAASRGTSVSFSLACVAVDGQ